MAETAWELGGDPELADLGLRRHAHAFGWGGLFLTKSRHYSSTFAELRAERARWREERRHRGVAPPNQTDHVLDADWEVVGIGWANLGETRFADIRWQDHLDQLGMGNEAYYTSSPSAPGGKPPEAVRQSGPIAASG